MADIIAMWQMEYPPGWIYFNFSLRYLAEPHPICEADGICQCSS